MPIHLSSSNSNNSDMKMKITVTTLGSITEVRFHKSLKIDFDHVLKNALDELNIRTRPEPILCKETVFFKLPAKIYRSQRISLEKKLCNACDIEYRYNCDIKRSLSAKANKVKIKPISDIICGFRGNLLADEPFEWIYKLS